MKQREHCHYTITKGYSWLNVMVVVYFVCVRVPSTTGHSLLPPSPPPPPPPSTATDGVTPSTSGRGREGEGRRKRVKAGVKKGLVRCSLNHRSLCPFSSPSLPPRLSLPLLQGRNHPHILPPLLLLPFLPVLPSPSPLLFFLLRRTGITLTLLPTPSSPSL